MELVGEKVFIRYLETKDAEALLQLESRNQSFFQMYTGTREQEFYTLEGQLQRIQRNQEKKDLDQNYSFGIFLIENGEMIGTLSLFEVLRGHLQSCFVGYFLDKDQNGKGYMTEAVRMIVAYSFEELKLHRIEAGVMPHNVGSMKVLMKAGFHKEGIARKNVKINGTWQDHQVLAIINEND
jgi:[ribosomal protein S5]-alanine N-acetyltransferase